MLDYDRPTALPDALRILSGGDRLVLAGGTDVYPATKAQALKRPVLDISAVETLRGITRSEDGMRIGACTTWSDIIAADLPPAFDALKLAAVEVGARQIQNVATIAGNLCNASPAADGVPPLLVLDAEVEMASVRGTRRVLLTDFITGVRRTVLQDDEMVTALHVPENSLGGRASFLKLGARKHLVISIAMIAARIDASDGVVTNVGLSVGSCSAVAVRLDAVEADLFGRPAEPGLSAHIADAAVADALSPIDDVRASASYRTHAAAELVRRTVEEALQ